MDILLSILQSEEFATLVTNLILTVVAIVVPFIASAVRGFIKSKESDTKYQMLFSIATMAVLAAEQAGVGGLIDDKKSAALGWAQAALNDRGLKFDLATIEAAIESAVAEELNRSVIQDAAYQKTQGAA